MQWEQCQAVLKLCCTKTHVCYYLCKGFTDVIECLPESADENSKPEWNRKSNAETKDRKKNDLGY